MIDPMIKLIILFFVIFDPFMSFAVFSSLTRGLSPADRKKTASLAILVACLVSGVILLFGEGLLELLSTDIASFKVAGGIVLGILGVKMSLGQSIAEICDAPDRSARAIAAIIGTPMLTGPAAISAIIISTEESGIAVTALAIGIVLLFTGILFYQAQRVSRILGTTVIQVLSTILGLVTLSWGVKLIQEGFGF